MNIKLGCSIANLTRRIIFNFSKDPFDKFNRKKSNPKQKVEQPQTPKRESPKTGEKRTSTRTSKTNASVFSAKTSKNEEASNDSREKQQEKVSSAFSKFSSHRLYNQQSKQESKKDLQKEKNEVFKQTQESEKKREEENQQQGKKDEAIYKSSEKEKEKEKDKSKNVIRTFIPGENEEGKQQNKDEDIVLRRPRGFLKKAQRNKQPIQPKQETETNTLQTEENEASKVNMKEQTQASIEQQKKKEEQHKQYQRWMEFQNRVKQMKHLYKLFPLRYIRLNLIKPDPKQEKKQKENKVQQPQLVNHTKNFAKLIALGVAIVLLSSNQYFTWTKSKEVDPEYLKKALDENRIVQTWFQITNVETNNEEHLKGKNIHKSVFIQDVDGHVFHCVSNPEFEKLWIKMLDDHNSRVDRVASFSNSPNGYIADQPARKIMMSPTRQAKKSSIVADARSTLSLVLLYFFIKSLMDTRNVRGKGTGATSLFDKEKSHLVKEAIKVTFKDVVGMQKAKEEIVEFIDFLKFPEKYNKLGARIPKGALLTGPPGTGKTMLAKACAGESKVPFFTISGSEFIEMYVGVGAQRVRNLFKEAKQAAPSIIFIDEIDAVGKKRTGMGGGGNDERDTTLNQLLVEMDGFDTGTNVIIFAATNQKEVLDPALTRPGRFDRLIEIDLPDLEGRREIFDVHLRPLVLDQHIDIKEYARRLATLTPGFSGADIKNVCNEAAIIAARNSKEFVSIMDFELATERIIGGVQKKSQLITPQTRKIVAYHECGHGVVSWFIKNANPLLKLTIIPRSKGALGFAQYLPNEHQMYTKDKLIDQICVILGGRISEEIFFNKISTGASDDLNKAYQIAKTLVTQYGFGEKMGWLQYDETEYAKEYSKEIENKIDVEILEIMRICSERTRKLIIEKKELIHGLAEKLLKMETIDQTTISSVLGERPFKPSKQHAEYIKEKKRQAEDILNYENQKAEGQKTEKVEDSSKIDGKDNNTVSMKRSDYLL